MAKYLIEEETLRNLAEATRAVSETGEEMSTGEMVATLLATAQILPNVVRATEQTLTEEQQNQARRNIDAASSEEVSKLSEEIADLKENGTGGSGTIEGLTIVTISKGDEPGTGEGETPTVYHSVTQNLENVTATNNSTSVAYGTTYSNTISAVNGYEINAVLITMGGTDITNDVYSDGSVYITSVTGDIIITITATEIVESGTVRKSLFDYNYVGGSVVKKDGSTLLNNEKCAYVEIPYVDGMYINTIMNSGWVTNYPAFLVKSPTGTITIPTATTDSTVYEVTLTGYEEGSTVIVNMYSAGYNASGISFGEYCLSNSPNNYYFEYEV